MQLKQQSEDFIVEEVYSKAPSGSGPFSWFWLEKKNLTTLEAVKKLAQQLNKKTIGFSGMKDKFAVTTQMCSVKGVSKERIEKIDIPNIKIKFVGFSEQPVYLGSHSANKFIIIVRDIEEKQKPKKEFLNFFGEQRFSVNNAEIGKALVQKNYKQAIDLVKESNTSEKHSINDFLENNPNNLLGALRIVPIKVLKIFVHAYQSKLWNKSLKEYSELPEQVPIIGFGTELDEVQKKILDKEGITTRDFVLKSIPQLSQEGTMRKTIMDVKDLKIGELEEDELNTGKKKVKMQFSLGPGSYATEVIKQAFE